MKFKDIDIKALTKKSVEQVYENRMPKEILKEEEEDKGRLPGSKRTLFDLFPFFQTSKKTFEFKGSNYPNEQLFRQIFANIANEDLSIAIKNLNNALGIVVREDGSHDFIEDASRGDISNTFSAISIVSNMYFASKANESTTGYIFEPIVAGLLSGRAIGFKNDIDDIAVDEKVTDVLDGNRISATQYSLKVISKEIELSEPQILLRLSQAKDVSFNVIVVVKNDINVGAGKGSVYNFYKIIINKENIMRSLFSYRGKDPGTKPLSKSRIPDWEKEVAKRTKEETPKKIATIETFLKSALSAAKRNKDYIPSEAHIKLQNIWDQFKAKYTSMEATPDIFEMLKDLEDTINNDPDPQVKVIYDSSKRSAAGRKSMMAESTIAVGAGTWNSMSRTHIGSILLAREVYEEKLKSEEGGLVNKFTELLLPLQNALDSTNQYFLQKDAGAKVQNLQKAQQETIKFKQEADKILNSDENQSQGQPGPLGESLDLTDEAKMVIDLLESYNRRTNG